MATTKRAMTSINKGNAVATFARRDFLARLSAAREQTHSKPPPRRSIIKSGSQSTTNNPPSRLPANPKNEALQELTAATSSLKASPQTASTPLQTDCPCLKAWEKRQSNGYPAEARAPWTAQAAHRPLRREAGRRPERNAATYE